MKREIVSDALNHIDESFICEAACFTPSESGGKEKQMNTRKLIKIVFIAAVLMSLMIVSAVAVEMLVYSPKKAVEVAQQELKKMQKIGLLSEELFIKDEPNNIFEFQEGLVTDSEGKTSKFSGKIYNHHYSVRSWADKCSVDFDVDVKDGIVRSFHIEATGEETDNRVDDREFELNGKMYYYYDNYDDIFRPDMTIDEFCSLLAEYWGFNGYKLQFTKDQNFVYTNENYDSNYEAAPNGDELLSSLCCKDFLIVSFDGDKRGESVAISLMHFPGRISLNVGRQHVVG